MPKKDTVRGKERVSLSTLKKDLKKIPGGPAALKKARKELKEENKKLEKSGK